MFHITSLHTIYHQVFDSSFFLLLFLQESFSNSGLFVVVSWISFVVPPDVIPGRMALLITLFLVLVNIFNTVTTNTPKAEGTIELYKLTFNTDQTIEKVDKFTMITLCVSSSNSHRDVDAVLSPILVWCSCR